RNEAPRSPLGQSYSSESSYDGPDHPTPAFGPGQLIVHHWARLRNRFEQQSLQAIPRLSRVEPDPHGLEVQQPVKHLIGVTEPHRVESLIEIVADCLHKIRRHSAE